MVEEPIQKMKTFTCGLFQLYFTENLFGPDENSEIQKHRKRTKIKTTETLLSKIFTTNKTENEGIVNKYMTEQQIKLE